MVSLWQRRLRSAGAFSGFTGVGRKRRGRSRVFLGLTADLCSCFGGTLVGGFLQGTLGLDGEGGKARGVVGGDVSEDLAVELVAGELEAVDEGGVAHAVDAGGSVDTDDPESAEL